MKWNCVIVMLLIGIVISGCKKTTETTPAGDCRMVRSSGTMNGMVCFYDDNHRISKMMYVSSPNDTSWENYYYDNGHVAYMVRLYKGTLGDTIYYTYDAGKYTRVDQYGFMQKYLYDNAGRLVRIERYDSTVVESYTDYIYDSRGNCIKCVRYYMSGSNPVEEERVEFEFGSNRNPYSSIGLPPLNSMGPEIGQYLSPDNITRIRMKYPQTVSLVLVYTYGAFNNNGYPLNFTIGDSLSHLMSNEVMEYECP
jgi:hypothetical protein